MKLPSSLMIGNTSYSVMQYTTNVSTVGRTYVALGAMYIATKKRKRPRSAKGISETFWHEVTHAILHDMGDPKWEDEKFVTAFSKRLSKAIDTARFK